MEEAKGRFFYTTHTPYKWSRGPIIHHYHLDIGEIDSIEKALGAAMAERVDSMGEDCVETTYGVEYKV